MDQRPNRADGVLEYDLGDGVMACVAFDGEGSGQVRLRSLTTGGWVAMSFEQIGKLNAAVADNAKFGRHHDRAEGCRGK
jgi:hypothetical protein